MTRGQASCSLEVWLSEFASSAMQLWIAIMAGHVDHSRFVAMFSERFPDVAAEIDECERGLLCLEMGVLTRATQKAISEERMDAVRDHFRFVDDVLRLATPDVVNAIGVAYLEHLSFDGRHGKRINARELLSPGLRVLLFSLETSLQATSAATRNRGFMILGFRLFFPKPRL